MSGTPDPKQVSKISGRGPAPKDPDTRARRNDDAIAPTPLRFVRAKQPKLPAGVKWHARTKAWWATWGDSPQAERFIATDWNFLLDTAVLHNMMWTDELWGLASEIRLRVAKFGATPEDRSRLRMQFVQPGPVETAEAQRAPAKSARERYAGLRVVPAIKAAKPTRKTAPKKAAPAKRTRAIRATAAAKATSAAGSRSTTSPAERGPAPVTKPRKRSSK